jgi:GTP-binding protein YchF
MCHSQEYALYKLDETVFLQQNRWYIHLYRRLFFTMSIKAGLVGLPNVGKSTLFNALTKSSIPAENYPFCTIDPHTAITEVPDKNLTKLAHIYNSQKEIPATVQFVDIAGLVKGAASGEGLGNQFLSHIREVDLILHVVRCFEDPNIIHHGETIDPIDDYNIIISELMLKDLESVQKRIEKLPKQIRGAQGKEKKELEIELETLQNIQIALDKGDNETVRKLATASPVLLPPFLAAKNFLIIANLAENELDTYQQNKHYQALVTKFGLDRVIPISAKTEWELSQLSHDDAQEMMGLLGLEEPGLDTIIRKTYANLGLITFFTCGPKEAHAWPIKKGITIRQAAGEIHSDLQKGFICAEIFNCHDLFSLGSEAKLKDSGKIRKEGQEYLVTDGDVIVVRFNV